MTPFPLLEYRNRLEWETSSHRFAPERCWVTRRYACERTGLTNEALNLLLADGNVRRAVIYNGEAVEETVVCLHDLADALGRPRYTVEGEPRLV